MSRIKLYLKDKILCFIDYIRFQMNEFRKIKNWFYVYSIVLIVMSVLVYFGYVDYLKGVISLIILFSIITIIAAYKDYNSGEFIHRDRERYKDKLRNDDNVRAE